MSCPFALFDLNGFSTFKDVRRLCNGLALEQNVDVEVGVGGVHSVANQERPVLTIQDLNPDPGELLRGRHHLHFEERLTRRRG